VTREDIIRMALEAGANRSFNPYKWDIWNIRDTDLERFAALVAAHEREECAKVCEAGVVQTNNWDARDYNKACEIRAAAIRNRFWNDSGTVYRVPLGVLGK
jgi:hypothetical protein